MNDVRFALTGSLRDLSPQAARLLFHRGTSRDPVVRERVAALLARVRAEGDPALRALTRELDGVALECLEVARAEWSAALERLEPGVRGAMERAARNITAVHRAFLPNAVEVSPEPGIRIGRRPDPLERVGVYAPGGRAAYPSSVLMCAIPARVAGVAEVILCSPPGPNGRPAHAVLAAAALAGVDRIFALGGAPAVGAMAFGTETVPRVDRIVGPGNAYVAEAKLQVVGEVGIDTPAGPSELLILADQTAEAAVVAREVLAQAEHDPDAAVVVVVLGDAAAAGRIAAIIGDHLTSEPRAEIITQALHRRGALLAADDLDQALAFAQRYAPEHLLLALRDPEAALPRIRRAGAVFLGQTASVAFGDYLTGANHVLPTGGLVRSYSGLSTRDFVRWTSWQAVTREAAAALADDTARFARAEALPAHAAAAEQWR